MNINPESQERYYCIRLTNKKDIYAFASHADVKDGAIVLLDQEEEIALAIPAGGWEYCFEASCRDGSPLRVEHWLDERRHQAPQRRSRSEQRLMDVDDKRGILGLVTANSAANLLP